MTVADICSIIDRIAPFSSQEEWDNSGLLVGSPSDSVTAVLFALDVTEPVIREAQSRGASLIVTHHPLMFSPRQRVTDEDSEGRLIASLIRGGISLIAAHTNLDRAAGGINDTLAGRCGLSDISGEGFFRSGRLPESSGVVDYVHFLEKALSCTVRIMGPANRQVRKVGVSSGGGSDAWKEAANTGCDVFVTGEMKHHQALEAAYLGLHCCVLGHYETENIVLKPLISRLQKENSDVQYSLTQSGIAPMPCLQGGTLNE